MTSHLAASITIAFALSISMLWVADAADAVGLACQRFEEGTSTDPTSGFTGTNVGLSIQTPGPSGAGSDKYLHTTDQGGTSYITASKAFLGDYTHLPQCASICFDVRLFNDGSGIPDGAAPHTLLTPSIQLFSGSTLSAVFTAAPTLQVAENVGWRHVCAPVGALSPTGALPNSQDGSWSISGGTNSDWPTILSNVTEIRLPAFDVTPAQTEKAGYDNFCIQPVDGCQSSINKDIKNATAQTADNLEILVQGDFLTVDWHFDGYIQHRASSFVMTTVGQDSRLLSWSGITPPVPPGEIFHAGFRVTGFTKILNLFWTNGDVDVGCGPQVNSSVQFPGDAPIALFVNDVGRPPCVVGRRHVGDISVEWFENEVPLDQLNATASRQPIRMDTFGPASLDLAPGARAPRPFPFAPPVNARFGMLRYTVSGPSLAVLDQTSDFAGPDQTIDFVQFGINSPSATSIPTLSWWGTMLFVLLLAAIAVRLIGRHA